MHVTRFKTKRWRSIHGQRGQRGMILGRVPSNLSLINHVSMHVRPYGDQAPCGNLNHGTIGPA